jgi:ribosomal protein S18 acetylase RimI-like enzyme
MSNEHHLCPVTQEDLGLLRKIFLSSWDRALAISPLPPESKTLVLHQQFDLQHQGYQRQYPHADYALIFLGDEPAGRIYVDRGPERFVLMDITLLPAHRGRGIGSAIIRALLDEAQAAGKPVTLHVEHWNPEARRLYHRLGFADLTDIGSHWKMQWDPA